MEPSQPVNYLRMSVTDRCQLRCRDCLPEEGVPLLPRGDILSYEEIVAFPRAAVREGITTVRLTPPSPGRKPREIPRKEIYIE